MPGASAADMTRHVGSFSGIYSAGVLFGALWSGVLSNRIGRGRTLLLRLMLVVNATLFFTGLVKRIASRTLIGFGLVLASAGLAAMGWHSSENELYLGISLTSGGTGLVLPVIAYLAAGVSHRELGFTMGALAAAAGLGQTVGSSLAGAIFGGLGWWVASVRKVRSPAISGHCSAASRPDRHARCV